MASDLDGARAAIETRLDDNWDDFTYPVQWAGQEGFEAPDDRVWLQVSILWGEGSYKTVGGTGTAKNEVVGVLNANLFQKPGQGLGEMYEAADTFRDLFDRVTVGSVDFGPASGLQTAGDPRQRAWEQRKVEVPFRLTETT